MEANILLKGLIIGFSIAAPVGPIGVLCIRRTLAEGRLIGLLSGLGAATADALYGCVAGFGLTLISSLLIGQQVWLSLIGGLFLCYLGGKTFLSKSAETTTPTQRNGLIKAYATTLFLTLTNPATILSFAAIFAGLGVASAAGDYIAATVLVLGVFLGSALWWLVLSGGVSLFRAKFSPDWLRWVNKISGVIIAGFGLLALASLLR
ncbi:MAG TPA: LysE family transporter, partial [Anaerolineae bacterium]|nr:LysE family transporter [Anaerolineae bacterium]